MIDVTVTPDGRRGDLVAALMTLTAAGVPVDVQEMLVSGNPQHGVEPNALSKALRAIIERERDRMLVAMRMASPDPDAPDGSRFNYGTLEIMMEQLEKARTEGNWKWASGGKSMAEVSDDVIDRAAKEILRAEMGPHDSVDDEWICYDDAHKLHYRTLARAVITEAIMADRTLRPVQPLAHVSAKIGE